jgi:hypothetical protein
MDEEEDEEEKEGEDVVTSIEIITIKVVIKVVMNDVKIR